MEEKPGSQTQFDQSSTTPGTDQSSTSINHFSHPHPLQGLNINSCAACKLEVSGMAYGCTMCNYILHQKCYKLPQQITHTFDQNNHILSLLPEPAYPEVIFYCDACGKPGDGFSYRCQSCVINLHTRCASMPMVYTHPSHHHPLKLTFSPPYPNKVFSCDICKMTGHNNWLYRCSVCEFDVHLTCINASPPKQNHSIYQPSSRPLIQIPYMMTSTYSSPPASMAMNSGAYGQQASAIMNQILSGASNGVAQPALQSLGGMVGSCGGLSNQSIGNSSQPNGGFGIMRSGARLAGLFGVGGDSGRDNGRLQDLFQGLSLSDNGSGAIPGMEYSGSDGDGQNTGAGGMNILQGLMGSGSDSASRNGLHPLGGYGGLSILNGLDMGGIVGGLLGAFTRRITRRIIRRISRSISRRITRRRTRRITRRIIRRIGRRIARRITWNI